MPSRRETFPVLCRGGLVTDQAQIQLGINNPGAARRLVNFEPSIQGGYRRINGYLKWDSEPVPSVDSANQILGVCFFDGSVIAAREGSIYTSAQAGWTAIATGRTQTTKHRFSEFNFSGTRKIIGCDSVNYPYTWDGTNFVNINGNPDIEGASFATTFKDHMFYAVGDKVVYSIPFDETDFTVGGDTGIILQTGTVTGMIVFRQQLFIFTEETISVLTGSSINDFQLTSVAEGTGCIAIDTVKEVAGDVAFLASDGVRLLGATDRDQDFSNQIASKSIQSDFDDFHDSVEGLHSVVIREKSQYRIFGWVESLDRSLSKGYIGTQFEAQNPQSFNWSEIIGMKVYSAYSQVFDGEEIVVFSGDTDFVYQMDQSSRFDTVEIESQYWTPYLSFSDPIYRKTLYTSYLYTAPEGDINGTLSLNYNFNSASSVQPSVRPIQAAGGGVLYGEAIYGADFYVDAPEAIVRTNLIGSGQNCSFQYNFDGGSPFIVDTIMVEYATEDRS